MLGTTWQRVELLRPRYPQEGDRLWRVELECHVQFLLQVPSDAPTGDARWLANSTRDRLAHSID